jgi:hypothetical protein
MPDISIQFYATPQELLHFTEEVARAFCLHIVALRYRPFEIEEVAVEDLKPYFCQSSQFRRWAFTIRAPNLAVQNELEHGQKNPDHLRLDVGEFDGRSLNESWLSCRTENKAAFTIWKKIARRLKEVTLPGITATSRVSGATVEYKTQRYSVGARELEKSGVTMVGPAGPRGPEVRLGLLLSQPPE